MKHRTSFPIGWTPLEDTMNSRTKGYVRLHLKLSLTQQARAAHFWNARGWQ